MSPLDTLVSPPVLAFLLGAIAALLCSDVRPPEAVHTGLSSYLLLSIGRQGGSGLRQGGRGNPAGRAKRKDRPWAPLIVGDAREPPGPAWSVPPSPPPRAGPTACCG